MHICDIWDRQYVGLETPEKQTDKLITKSQTSLLILYFRCNVWWVTNERNHDSNAQSTRNGVDNKREVSSS